MLNIFTQLLDVLLPPHESVFKIRPETVSSFSRHFHQQHINETEVLMAYTHEVVKAAITANKFHNCRHGSVLLASILTQFLETLPGQENLLVPIPLSTKREKERGYNQVTRVISYIPQEIGTLTPLLIRERHTEAQTSLKRQARLLNMKNVFRLSPTAPSTMNPAVTIILIDDVMTTGATLKAAASVLHKAYPHNKLICVALAH